MSLQVFHHQDYGPEFGGANARSWYEAIAMDLPLIGYGPDQRAKRLCVCLIMKLIMIITAIIIVMITLVNKGKMIILIIVLMEEG